MPTRTRVACALVAFPLGWAVREAVGGAAGGVVVLGLVAVCAARLPRRRATLVAVAGLLGFAVVHVVARATTVHAGLAVGAALYALACARWAASSSSEPRATRAS